MDAAQVETFERAYRSGVTAARRMEQRDEWVRRAEELFWDAWPRRKEDAQVAVALADVALAISAHYDMVMVEGG